MSLCACSIRNNWVLDRNFRIFPVGISSARNTVSPAPRQRVVVAVSGRDWKNQSQLQRNQKQTLANTSMKAILRVLSEMTTLRIALLIYCRSVLQYRSLDKWIPRCGWCGKRKTAASFVSGCSHMGGITAEGRRTGKRGGSEA